MRGLNKCYLIGHVGRDPETRTSKEGLAIAKLTLATPRGHKVEGTWVDTPDWHRVTAFGRDAEFLSKFARKGDGLALECAVRPGKWIDRAGATRYGVDMIIERVLWLQGKRAAASSVVVAAVDEPPMVPPVDEHTDEVELVSVDDGGEGAVIEAVAAGMTEVQAQVEEEIPF
jgi:single-strand DNA-binding protein